MSKRTIVGVASIAAFGLIIAATAFAAGPTGANAARGARARVPGAFETVSAINGTTLSVTSKTPKSGTATTYAVDASNAKVMKNGTSSSVSVIAVGDTVMVQGTVNGTNVAATVIRDSAMRGRPGSTPPGQPQNLPIQGNGEPVVGGNVTAANGTTLTVTNKSNVVYAVDASNAKVEKAGTSTSVSAISVGDNVIIQGTVNGTSVTASSVIDQGNGQPKTATSASESGAPGKPVGFFGAIGNFFARLFEF